MSPLGVDGVDLTAVRLFLSVVELGSVSKAAARHSITQPSATSKLQKLERRLGVALLERSPTGSTATPSGVRLAPACAELLVAAGALTDRAASLRDDETHLRIASTRHVAEHRLPEWTAEIPFHDVRIDVVELDTLRVAQAVRSGDVSLGFVEGPNAPVGLRSEVVATEQLVAVVGRSHPWADRRRSLTPNQIVSSTMVLTRIGSGTRDVVEDAFAAHELGAVGEHIEVDNAAAVRIAVGNGAGVGFLPRCRVERDLANGRLAEIPIRSVSIFQPVRVVWRGGAPSVRPARVLVDSIVGRGAATTSRA